MPPLPAMRTRYSAWNLLAAARQGHRDWAPAWRDAEPKPRYDVVIVGGGGHGPATAYYLAKNQNSKWHDERHLFPYLRCAAVGRQEPS